MTASECMQIKYKIKDCGTSFPIISFIHLQQDLKDHLTVSPPLSLTYLEGPFSWLLLNFGHFG